MYKGFREFWVTCDNTRFYCREAGEGRPVLMIHGSCVNSDFFLDTARYLSDSYRVVIYDRRGYGRSEDGPANRHCIEEQVKDAAAIARTMDAPVNIVAHSAGTVIAMELAASYPELINCVFLHEPTAADCASDDGTESKLLSSIYSYINQGKYTSALSLFLTKIGAQDCRAREKTADELSFFKRDSSTFIRTEFSEFFSFIPNYAALAQIPISVGVGELSRGSHRWDLALALADRLSCRIIYFPGGHNCAFDLPQEFAFLVTGSLHQMNT